MSKSKTRYTKKMLNEFRTLVQMAESHHQMERIKARIEQPKFIEKHGRDVCDEMFEVLKKEMQK